MSMTQLVSGTALGFLCAQALLYCLRELRTSIAGYAERSREALPVSALISGFVRYAPLVAASAALATLGVWALKDHLAAKRAGTGPAAEALDAAGAGSPLADSRAGVDDITLLTQPGGSNPGAFSSSSSSTPSDPYGDPDFRRPARPRHGGALSLKDALVQRSEGKAREDLLRDMRQQRDRSQYDCEAAARAERYLKAGLDVWGFAAWEQKYFPVDTYQGATLPECRNIKSVVDPTRLNLQSAVAQGNRS